jgi:hypothetical protein
MKIKKFNNFKKINEEFGNGIYQGKKILIPDDFAIWC